MPAYHSAFLHKDHEVRTIGNFSLHPLRTKTRGSSLVYTLPPLPPNVSDLDVDPDSEYYDILDETLTLFRANTLFRNFEIKGPADRVLIYGILWTAQCLGKVKPNMTQREAEKALNTAALDHFSLPGDPGFPLNAMFQGPADRNEAEQLRGYISQLRQELAIRLVKRLYADGTDKPSKWWLSFNKKKFMGHSL